LAPTTRTPAPDNQRLYLNGTRVAQTSETQVHPSELSCPWHRPARQRHRRCRQQPYRSDPYRARPAFRRLARLENLLAVFLAWWLVPVTLLVLWTRYLPAHGWRGTTSLVFLIGATTLFGRHTYRLARAALQGKASSNVAEEADESRGVLKRAWHELHQLHPDKITAGVIGVLIVCSVSAFRDNPRDPYTWVAKSLNALHFVGVRTYADLREIEVAHRPEGWTGEEWDKVKRVDLRTRNLAFVDATRAFLANADLRGANLKGATLVHAELQGADFYDDDLQRGARLQGANLVDAQLQGADLRAGELQGVNFGGVGAALKDRVRAFPTLMLKFLYPDLRGDSVSVFLLSQAADSFAELGRASLPLAQLQGADLRQAQLQGDELVLAQLQGVDFRDAQLQGVDFSLARLQGADFRGAQLQGVKFVRAQLQGADFRGADLQGADLRSAHLWRALVHDRDWNLVDLRRTTVQSMSKTGVDETIDRDWNLVDLRQTTVQPMSKTGVDETIAKVSASITDESQRRETVEGLTKALETDDRPTRPKIQVGWQSHPGVMFDQGDPKPEPFLWGPPKWETERAYDQDLARFLGDLACATDAPEAQIHGLVRRARDVAEPLLGEPDRLWPRLFAARLTGAGCPQGEALPDDMRRELEQLADRSDTSPVAPEASPP
jgi:uncharacterized protein YjbI with pentapeptide repeats